MTRQEIIANLKGIFPPVVTPFNRRGGVDEGRYRANLERYAEAGLSGVVVAGSTGEAPYLTERERMRLVEVARRVIRAPQLLIAGTGLESTPETLRLSRAAVARGADALLALTPNYYKSRMNSRTLIRHFRALGDGLRRPIIIYNIPQFTGIRMEPKALAELSRHPNIVGVKESSGDLAYVRAILRAIPATARSRFKVLVGSATILFEALRSGAAGGILGQAGFAPELCVALYEAFRTRRITLARDLQARLVPLAQKISVAYGVSGIKAALDLCGYAGGAPRPPLVPLEAAGREAVAAAIQEARAGLEF